MNAVIVGGGAAGFFAAIRCAETARDANVMILEKTGRFLDKVRISGGGRCNVTHSCFDPREFTRSYPRGERELLGPLHQFNAEDAVQWFQRRGVRLKTESDGRMFPVTDSSQTIIDCLMHEAEKLRVRMRLNSGVMAVARKTEGFHLTLSTGESLDSDKLLLATGGCRTAALGQLAVSLGHGLELPVPSLFTFQIEEAWVRELAGVSVPRVELSIPGMKLGSTGALLFTHWGLSGPAVLRLSAWGARALHGVDYCFPLRIRWSEAGSLEKVRAELIAHGRTHGSRLVHKTGAMHLPQRLWEALAVRANIPVDRRWGSLPRAESDVLAALLAGTELLVKGKSLNKDEFVTCGGVALREVNCKTMESKLCPGLYFAGELLDIDGITGGFNFQAAWTTGFIAGENIGRALASR